MKTAIVFIATVFMIGCGSNSGDITYSLVESSCNMPQTEIQLGDEFIKIQQNGSTSIAETKMESGITSGFSLTVRRFISGNPQWETLYHVSSDSNTLTFSSTSCTNKFQEN